MWQALPRQEITPIRLRKSEDFHEFYTPYRPDWSQSVSANACFTIAFNTVVKDKILPLNPQLAAATGFQQEITMLRHGQDAKHPCKAVPKLHPSPRSQPSGCWNDPASKDKQSVLHVFTDRFSRQKQTDGDFYPDRAALLQLVCLFVCVC